MSEYRWLLFGSSYIRLHCIIVDCFSILVRVMASRLVLHFVHPPQVDLLAALDKLGEHFGVLPRVMHCWRDHWGVALETQTLLTRGAYIAGMSALAAFLDLPMWCAETTDEPGDVQIFFAADLASGVDVVGKRGFVVGSAATLDAMCLPASESELAPVVVLEEQAHRGEECARVFHEAAAATARASGEPLYMPYMRQVRGDLKQAAELCIGHQANATSTYAAGLALSLFEKWPEVDVYAGGETARQLGTTIVSHTHDGKVVLHLVAQRYPGAPGQTADSPEVREAAFRTALRSALATSKDFASPLALPHSIGCCRGGGDWDRYLEILDEETRLSEWPVVLYAFAEKTICSVCNDSEATTTHRSGERVCIGCVDRCVDCFRKADAFPLADGRAALGGAPFWGAGSVMLGSRASAQSWERELLQPERSIPAWRSAGCANCDYWQTHALHSALLHVRYVHYNNWSVQDVSEMQDRQLSVSHSVLRAVLIASVWSTKAMLDWCDAWEEDKAEAAAVGDRASTAATKCRAAAQERRLVHVVRLPVGAYVDFGSADARCHTFWWTATDHWSVAKQWRSACNCDEIFEYARRWGDALAEIVADRAALNERSAFTFTVEELPTDLRQACENFASAAWGAHCASCTDGLEARLRDWVRCRMATTFSVCATADSPEVREAAFRTALRSALATSKEIGRASCRERV